MRKYARIKISEPVVNLNSQIIRIKPSLIDNDVYYTTRKCRLGNGRVMMIRSLVGSSDETCTPTFLNEFARIYSLPTYKYYIVMSVTLDDTLYGLVATNS